MENPKAREHRNTTMDVREFSELTIVYFSNMFLAFQNVCHDVLCDNYLAGFLRF